MAMNNSANLVKYPGSLHPTSILLLLSLSHFFPFIEPSFPHDPLLSTDKLDFSHITKHDPKFPMDAFNDIFAGNMSSNPSMNPLMDRNNPNPDFFLNQGANSNMTLDSGLLYGFPNVNNPSQGNPNPSMGDPSAMYQQNRNMMFPGGMPNQPMYEDLMKASNQADYLYLNQLGFNDKNLLGSNMLGENMGFLDRNNQFLFQGLEQELAQSGQMPFQNPLFLNNLMGGGDFNLQNLFGMPGMPGMPGMSGLGFEDLFQMQSGMQNPNMPNPFGGMPGQNVPGSGAGGFSGQGNTPNMQQAASGQNAGAGGRQMPKVEMNPAAARQMGGQQGDWGNMNPQMMQGLQGMNQANFGGFPSLKVEGQGQLQKGQTNMKQQQPQQGMSQTGSSPHMGPNAGNLAAQKNMAANMARPPQNVKTQSQAPMNKPMNQDINAATAAMNHQIKPLMASKSEPPQSQQANKPNMYGMNPGKPQEGIKNQDESNNQKAMSMWPEGLMMPPDLSKMAQSAGPAGMMKANGMMNPGDFGDLFGKGLFDPLMMGKTMKDNQVNPMDPFGLNGDLFLGPQMDVYNKLKEKNKYERSLKIERYKNKKRNWQKKIAYECRRRVANTRLRIKGRFISKKDCEKINEFVGENNEAFNDKKNLNLDYITSKLNVYGEEEDNSNMIHKKFNISKNHILNKIDDIINNKKHSLSTINVANFNMMKEKVGKLLRESKKIFKLEKRQSSFRGYKATREESSGSNSVSSTEHKQNIKQDQLENYGMEENFAYPGQLQGANEPQEAPMGYNDPYMAMNQQAFERMIAQDERFANVPKEMLEAMMMNMMQMQGMGMGMGMHQGGMDAAAHMGVGNTGR